MAGAASRYGVTVIRMCSAARQWDLRYEVFGTAEFSQRCLTFAPNSGGIALYEPKQGSRARNRPDGPHLELDER